MPTDPAKRGEIPVTPPANRRAAPVATIGKLTETYEF